MQSPSLSSAAPVFATQPTLVPKLAIVELLSNSTAEVDKGTKKDIYERVFRTRDYFVFDPFAANSLEGWHLDVDRGYQASTPNERGWLWCQSLEL